MSLFYLARLTSIT